MLAEFDPQFDPKLIAVVGLGGTGSQWARSIARMAWDMQHRGLECPRILFIDPDTVEEKNVGRQMFTATDVGKNKAEVLARRFNHALGLDIAYRPEKVHRDMFRFQNSQLYWSNYSETGYGSSRHLLLCGAVDNHLARRELAQIEAVWIDAGNHFSSGQVVIGDTSDSGEMHSILKEMESSVNHDVRLQHGRKVRHLLNVAGLFPDMLKPQTVHEIPLSCADLVALGDQHLLVNDLVATVAAGYTFNLLYRQPIQTFISYVDVLNLSVRSVPITPEELRAFAENKSASTL